MRVVPSTGVCERGVAGWRRPANSAGSVWRCRPDAAAEEDGYPPPSGAAPRPRQRQAAPRALALARERNGNPQVEVCKAPAAWAAPRDTLYVTYIVLCRCTPLVA